ncbi:MAG TPA: mannose-1-phosphate guanylyltransferase [Prolixibacteraceae bacterium]|nr:mannose-1-phosphate guanylyltransferase [Prolixibacteraceae bacterium]
MGNCRNYCVIMAGGIGSRFWPLSTADRPKQFIDILGIGKTLLQLTFERFNRIIPAENVYVVTSEKYRDLVMEQLPQLNESQVLLEPLRRNTAPCIAYATYKILSVCPTAKIVVSPSDHLILKEDLFLNEIEKGLQFAGEKEVLVTLGIQPSRPETGYGYIQVSEKLEYNLFDNLFKVKTFTEKPDRAMAQVFVDTGEFYWNSGIFVWSALAIQNAFEKYLPDLNTIFDNGKKLINTPDECFFINKTYSECPNISIDYGVMEKADNVYVLTADFGWSDLGTWGSLYENHPLDKHGNAVSGSRIFLYETEGCIVNLPEEKITVIEGLKDYIVVESGKILLICKKDDEQQIRQFVADVMLSEEKKT